MNNCRTYGQPPYLSAVLHGGPGAVGEMSPVAAELGRYSGILEPLQIAATVDGQVHELHDTITANTDRPITIIGFSWGAWLGWIFTAKHPELVAQLILVGSGPFEEKYTDSIMSTRLQRLSEAEEAETAALLPKLEANDPDVLARFGELMTRADSFDLIPDTAPPVELRQDIYHTVWPEAAELRRSGQLLALGSEIRCPVLAIHGDYDPHPAAGVSEPLQRILPGVRFLLLEKCGHYPWREQSSRGIFYDILKKELGKAAPGAQ